MKRLLYFVKFLLLVSTSYLTSEASRSKKISREGFQDNYFSHNGYSPSISTSSTECPTWFAFNNRTNQCECGNEIGGIVHCDQMRRLVYIVDCYCMTHDNQLGIAVGSCSTNCAIRASNTSIGSYTLLPSNISQLNEVMCGERWNRNNRFCGKCKDGYYQSVYSYGFSCVKCTNSELVHNWGKFIAFAFVSLTIFYILALVIRIDTTHQFPEGLITYAHIIAASPSVRLGLAAVEPYPKLSVFIHIIFTLYGFWNLDFFRSILPPTCLNIDTLQALILDYAIAFYPLILVIITYFLIELHDNDCTLIVWMFRPFGKCAKINIKSSVIIVFSAFLRLSYAKLVCVSFDLLVPVWAHDMSGRSVGVYLYYDASIEYFGKEHIPYALLASFVLIAFVILPIVLLATYPLRCCNFLRKWSTLRVCLDTYQGYYKDGTNGTMDCRWFSCIYLLVRLLLLSVFNFVTNSYFYALAAIIFLLMTLLHVVVKPYRENFHQYNNVHTLLSLNMAVLFMTVVCIDISSLQSFHTKIFSIVICGLILTSFLIYALGHLLHRIYLLLARSCRFII